MHRISLPWLSSSFIFAVVFRHLSGCSRVD